MSNEDQMDTNGYVHHPHLRKHAKKRFLRAAFRLAEKLKDNESLDATVAERVGFLQAYMVLKNL